MRSIRVNVWIRLYLIFVFLLYIPFFYVRDKEEFDVYAVDLSKHQIVSLFPTSLLKQLKEDKISIVRVGGLGGEVILSNQDTPKQKPREKWLSALGEIASLSILVMKTPNIDSLRREPLVLNKRVVIEEFALPSFGYKFRLFSQNPISAETVEKTHNIVKSKFDAIVRSNIASLLEYLLDHLLFLFWVFLMGVGGRWIWNGFKNRN